MFSGISSKVKRALYFDNDIKLQHTIFETTTAFKIQMCHYMSYWICPNHIPYTCVCWTTKELAAEHLSKSLPKEVVCNRKRSILSRFNEAPLQKALKVESVCCSLSTCQPDDCVKIGNFLLVSQQIHITNHVENLGKGWESCQDLGYARYWQDLRRS